MRKSGQILLLLFVVLGLIALGSCGGGATSLGSFDNQPGNSVDGVSNGSFKAIRFNDLGYHDSALNPTLNLNVSQDSATTTVTVSIADTAPMISACVDLYYDQSRFSPIKAEFSGLVDTPLELASTKTAGLVSIGQASTSGLQVHSGQFATVTFANSPLRQAAAAGDAHQVAVNRTYAPPQIAPASQSGFVMVKGAIDATDALYGVFATFAVGDGDQNGATNLGDLTAMAFNGYATFLPAGAPISATDFGTAPTDYDGNGETNLADLTPLGQRLNETTTAVEVRLADDGNDFAANAGTVIATHTWASGSQPTRPPAANTTDFAALFVNWNGNVTLAQAQAADTDADGSVAISANAVGGGAAGPAFTDAAAQITYSAGVPGVSILGLDVDVVETGNTNSFSGAGGDMDVVAGDTGLVLNVTGISGDFDPDGPGGPTAPLPFSPGALAAGMTQQNYDDALAVVQTDINWNVTVAGDSTNNEFRTAGGIIMLSANQGSGVTGSVSPDADNPDSTLATTPEGILTASLAASGNFIPLAIAYNINVDVLDDPAAPFFTSMISNAAPQGSYQGINSLGSTTITGDFTEGTAPVPANPADITCLLLDTTTPGGSTPISFTAGTIGALNDGEFSVEPSGGTFKFTLQMGAVAVPGIVYGLSIGWDNGAGGTTYSSINYPNGTFFTTAPLPAEVTYETIPDSGTGGADPRLGPSHDTLVIVYPGSASPIMRRDPRVDFLITPTPRDPAGHADVILQGMAEFPTSTVGLNNFPHVIVAAGNDPSVITSTTPDTTGAQVVARTQGAVVVDILAITNGGTTAEPFAFRVYGPAPVQANWPSLGSGTFTYDPMAIITGNPTGDDFGINIFDGAGRGDLSLANPDFSGKTVNGDNFGTDAQTDVFWVQLSGYGMFNFDAADPFYVEGAPSNFNTLVRFVRQGVGTTMDRSLMPRTSLDINGNLLATFEITNNEFTNPGFPGWTGIFNPGDSYDVLLVDPQSPGTEFTFGTPLIVIGDNPNIP